MIVRNEFCCCCLILKIYIPKIKFHLALSVLRFLDTASTFHTTAKFLVVD
jgi:hypothetical protein